MINEFVSRHFEVNLSRDHCKSPLGVGRSVLALITAPFAYAFPPCHRTSSTKPNRYKYLLFRAARSVE